MSDHSAAPSGQGRSAAGVLSIRVPPDDRFRVVLETAVRIYVRPICGSAALTPDVNRALAEMVDQLAALDPIEVVFECRLSELEVSVTSGDRRTARMFRVEVKG